jgi:arginyl-tRNA synthetase
VLKDLLEARLAPALHAAGAPEGSAVALTVSTKPEFGDYQMNGAMGAAKRLKRPPRELAEAVLAHAKLDDLVSEASIAGPGFINLRLRESVLEEQLGTFTARVINPKASSRETGRVVIDYSSPNLAKEMHVGHLRSTIIGDALARCFAHAGWEVLRQNHVGDWGTQFGMLLAYLNTLETGDGAPAAEAELSDLEVFYRKAKARFDEDSAFAALSRETVVKLQQGDPACRAAWQRFIDVSLSHCEALYGRLQVTLTREHVQAESAYNEALPGVIAALREQGLLTESDGAQCVFLDEFKGKDDTLLPLIVQKSDGGYLYATTDLAAVRYRCDDLEADRALYLVDKRQGLHFKQVFAVAEAAGFITRACSFEHMPFGTMLGEDGRPFRTRAGDVVKLADLLDEAERRAEVLVAEKNPDLDAPARAEIARAIAIGAVKYADLSKHRNNDYVFSWDAMLSFDGNTAPYLQYAYSRIQSLFARAQVAPEALSAGLSLGASQERSLALTLLRTEDVLTQVRDQGLPHLLCAHLYDVATAFTAFYEHCPVLGAPEERLRDQRLALAHCCGETLRQGLELLGIPVVQRM